MLIPAVQTWAIRQTRCHRTGTLTEDAPTITVDLSECASDEIVRAVADFASMRPAHRLPSSCLWNVHGRSRARHTAFLCGVTAFPLLPAQCKQEIELFVRYGTHVRRKVCASHEFSDAILGIVINAWNSELSFPIAHGGSPSIRKAFLPKSHRNVVNKPLTLAVSICWKTVNGPSISPRSCRCSKHLGAAAPSNRRATGSRHRS